MSLYFHDPEGNLLEVYWPTGRRVDDSISEPLDLDVLDRREAELLEMLGAPA